MYWYIYHCPALIDDSGIDIKKVVCYGIGRVSSDLTAQYQLSVLLCLMEIIKVFMCVCLYISMFVHK